MSCRNLSWQKESQWGRFIWLLDVKRKFLAAQIFWFKMFDFKFWFKKKTISFPIFTTFTDIPKVNLHVEYFHLYVGWLLRSILTLSFVVTKNWGYIQEIKEWKIYPIFVSLLWCGSNHKWNVRSVFRSDSFLLKHYQPGTELLTYRFAYLNPQNESHLFLFKHVMKQHI